MSSSREPLLTLSPSHLVHVGATNTEEPLKHRNSPQQTTPTLPRRERLASFSRLLRNEKFAEFARNQKKPVADKKWGRAINSMFESPVNVNLTPSSPSKENSLQKEDSLLKYEKGYLSPNNLPFSPRLLNKRSPVHLSPDYRHPSPLRSPLYKPVNGNNFLGRGSFGKVSLIKCKSDRNLAVKIAYQPSQYIGEKNFLEIRHPHLVEIYYVSEVLDRTLIFMEFAGHCNLQQILDTKSELELRRRLSFCAQIASGLRHCHQHFIVHGDVKPANVMVSPFGICKLGDFGHSINLRKLDTYKSTHPIEDMVGTAAYAAPEVLRGSYPTPSSDMYSFGILLWQVETREIPFAGEHPHVIIYKVASYGERPKFSTHSSHIMELYIKTTENCWRTVPEERIDASRALINIQEIMQLMKECK